MTWWTGARRKLDREDKFQIFGMIGLAALGVVFVAIAMVNVDLRDLSAHAHAHAQSLTWLWSGFSLIAIGMPLGLAGVVRALRRIYRERDRPRVEFISADNQSRG
jgi:cell division protein FtsW (lipid II flippase)